MRTELQKGHVYAWWTNYCYLVSNQERRIQGDNYALEVHGDRGGVTKLGLFPEGTEWQEYDFSQALPVDCRPAVTLNGIRRELLEVRMPLRSSTKLRILEAGRYLHRTDIPHLDFGTEDFLGSFECAAMRDRFWLNFQIFPAAAGSAVPELSFQIPGAAFERISPNACCIRFGPDRGFAVWMPRGTVEVSEAGAVLTDTLSLQAKKISKLSAVFLPFEGDPRARLEAFLAESEVRVCAELLEPQHTALSVSREPSDGTLRIDLTKTAVSCKFRDWYRPENRAACDRVRFTVQNPTEHRVRALLSFRREGGRISIYGFTPMLRDADCGAPLAEQVQISKNWHSAAELERVYGTKFHPEHTYTGEWYHGYTELVLEPFESRNAEYRCCYAEWDGVSAVSHAQLCLAGWGGNTTWDQIAIGSYGENITLQNECGHTFVNDVRPIFVRNPVVGRSLKYNWGGNVGGCQFLAYPRPQISLGERQRTEYRAQGPCVSDVHYECRTTDGLFRMLYTVRIGRTADVSRFYYRLRYELLREADLSEISFFAMNTWRYKQDSFRRYAFGHLDETVFDGARPEAEDGEVLRVLPAYTDDWFLLYDSSSVEENANVCFCLRAFRAQVGETRLDAGEVRIRNYAPNPDYGQDGVSDQVGFEIGLPHGIAERVPAGSTVELVIEHTVLPAQAKTFYGPAAYLRESKRLFNTAAQGAQQAYGNKLSLNASLGRVKSVYPPEIGCLSDACAAQDCGGLVLADLTLGGGLGHTPLIFSGLRELGGLVLLAETETGWELCCGTETMQAYPLNGALALACNVENGAGKHRYRLVRSMGGAR